MTWPLPFGALAASPPAVPLSRRHAGASAASSTSAPTRLRIRRSAIPQGSRAVNFARRCDAASSGTSRAGRARGVRRLAQALLARDRRAMWMALGRNHRSHGRMEEVLPGLEAIAQFAEELRGRL